MTFVYRSAAQSPADGQTTSQGLVRRNQTPRRKLSASVRRAMGAALGLVGQGCSTESAMVGPPTYVAETPHVVNGTLSVLVEARNAGDQTITFELYSPCTVTIRVYTQASVLAWDQLDLLNARPPTCKWVPRPKTLKPGESIELMPSAEVAQILGDSLASGTYRVAVVVAQAAPDFTLVEVPAGEVALVK